jgi:hypothetical protein
MKHRHLKAIAGFFELSKMIVHTKNGKQDETVPSPMILDLSGARSRLQFTD